MSASQHQLPGARRTGELRNVTETGAENVGDVLTVTSTAPLTAAWQAAAGAFLPLAGGTMSGNIIMGGNTSVEIPSGSTGGVFFDDGVNPATLVRVGDFLSWALSLDIAGQINAQNVINSTFSGVAFSNIVGGYFELAGGSAVSAAFDVRAGADTFPRLFVRRNGEHLFGDGSFNPSAYPGAYLKWKDAGRLEIGEQLNVPFGYWALPTAPNDVFRSALSTDAAGNIRYAMTHDGAMRWGTGASTAGDNIISRIPAGFMRQVAGALKHPMNFTTFTGPGVFTMQDHDTVALVDTSAGPATVNLPITVLPGDEVVVKDSGGNASVNAITIVPTGNIDGVAGSITITTDDGSLRLMTDGVDWWRIGVYP